jgi:hypothetical protein
MALPARNHDLALSYGLDPALKPTKLDISETVRWLDYKPAYSLANLLSELAAFGDSGPPHFTETKEAHAPPLLRHGGVGSPRVTHGRSDGVESTQSPHLAARDCRGETRTLRWSGMDSNVQFRAR